MDIRKGLITMIAAGTLALTSACGLFPEDDGNGGGGGGSSGKAQCYNEMSTDIDNSGLVSIWGDDFHGANNVFVYEVEECGEDYCYKDGTKVKSYALTKGEILPGDSTWKAGRRADDDYNLRKFPEEDPLIIGYFPWIPRSSVGWHNENSTYDWRCEDGDTGETNGLENCLGLNQLDTAFTTNTLQDGKNYIARFFFGFNASGPNNQGQKNFIGSCGQVIFEYEE